MATSRDYTLRMTVDSGSWKAEIIDPDGQVLSSTVEMLACDAVELAAYEAWGSKDAFEVERGH